MTNATTTSTQTTVPGFSHQSAQHSDEAPMVITRLSGWIDMTEVKASTPSWIIRTKLDAPAH